MWLSPETYDAIIDDKNWSTIWTLVPEYHIPAVPGMREIKGKAIQVFDLPMSNN